MSISIPCPLLFSRAKPAQPICLAADFYFFSADARISSAFGTLVVVSSNGKLGVATSSGRFKESIKPIATASKAVLKLANP